MTAGEVQAEAVAVGAEAEADTGLVALVWQIVRAQVGKQEPGRIWPVPSFLYKRSPALCNIHPAHPDFYQEFSAPVPLSHQPVSCWGPNIPEAWAAPFFCFYNQQR